METIIKGCVNIKQYNAKKQKLIKLANRAYKDHNRDNKDIGTPCKAWFYDKNENEICIKYADGKTYKYSDVELPFITIEEQ